MELPYEYLVKENYALYKMLMTLLPQTETDREDLRVLKDGIFKLNARVNEVWGIWSSIQSLIYSLSCFFIFLLCLLKGIIDDHVPILEGNALDLWPFDNNKTKVSHNLLFCLNCDNFGRCAEDEVHGFVPAFELTPHFPSPIKLYHYLFVFQFL